MVDPPAPRDPLDDDPRVHRSTPPLIPPRRVWFPPGSSVGLAVVGVVAVGLAVLWWFTGRATSTTVPMRPASVSAPPATPVAVSPPTPSQASPTQTSVASPSPAALTVDVRGRVQSPGIIRLPSGSRVMDAVEAAGGLLPGHRYGEVNLARILVDGEQIRIGTDSPDAGPGPMVTPPTPMPATTAPGGLINLNTATAVELEEVDGVGPVLAAAIVQWRTDNGPYLAVEDLLDVSGIGEATLAGMRDQVTVG